MELDWAQLLVHTDATLEKFRVDHDISNDVQKEWSDPNEDANLLERNEDRIPVQIWLIY